MRFEIKLSNIVHRNQKIVSTNTCNTAEYNLQINNFLLQNVEF